MTAPAPAMPTGVAIARTLRRELPAALAADRDLFEIAFLAGFLHGAEAAGLASANALRIQLCHSIRRLGHPEIAAPIARELLIDLAAMRAAGVDV
jgi:hypothetical protein